MNNRFAAFIMTYERPGVLKETISLLQDQTVPPEKILVIDNSESGETEEMLRAANFSDISYHNVGYNAGPAGAAALGLQMLAVEGFDWIFWGDDDDPPSFKESNAILLDLITTHPARPGIVGAVGQYFNTNNGNIHRVTDDQLKNDRFIDIDSIAGNQCMIVNAEVVRKGILPNKDLFFGFEELDFCLRVKKAGYRLLASTELFIRHREKFKRQNFQPAFYSIKTDRGLVRQYYSTRNLLYILKNNKMGKAYFYQGVKSIIKTLFGFRYGARYGMRNAKMITKGIADGLRGKLGKMPMP